MDDQARELNQSIATESPAVLQMLSERGKNIFFPKSGIIAQAAQAKGKEINATIGEAIEDDGTSMYLKGLTENISLTVPEMFPYTPSFGKKELRDYWRTSIYRKNPSLSDMLISDPIATSGLTHGVSMASYMFLDRGDEILVSDLYWENYDLIFEKSCGAKIRSFRLFSNGAFDVDSFAEAIGDSSSDKVAILLNFPNNPAGYTPTEEEADKIAVAVKDVAEQGKKLVIFIDDAYFGLVFEEGVYTESIFAKLAGLHENVLAVKMDAATKEDYVWGFRVGFITYGIKGGTAKLYAALEDKTGGAVRANISNISNISQSLLYRLYKSADYEVQKKEKFSVLKARYSAIKECLAKNDFSDAFVALPYNSGYFMCVQVLDGIDAEAVRKVLLDRYSTGVVVFNNVIRLAFSAVPEAKIETLLKNVYAACKDVQ